MKIIIIVLICLVVFWLIKREMKSIKEPNVYLVTGGVKTGKSAVSLWLAIRRYKRIHFRWKVKRFIQRLFKKEESEEPLFYSNIPVTIDYVPLTRDILLRKKRLRYKSVTFIDEASLVADSYDFTDEELTENLKLFEKLYGHETCGGYLYHNTQNLKDVHFNIKRSLCSYLWVHHLIKWIPFVVIAKVREMYYSDEQGIINNFNEDIEDTTKTLVMSKSVFKKYDCYCYSVLTDDLEVEDKVLKDTVYLKQKDILYIGSKKQKNKSKRNKKVGGNNRCALKGS